MGLCNSKQRLVGDEEKFEPYKRTISKLEHNEFIRKDAILSLGIHNIKDFFVIHEKNLLVLLTGDFYKSEFSFKNDISIPSKEIFTPIFSNSLSASVDYIPQAFFSEAQKESCAPAQITFYSIKSRKPVKRFSGFSQGLSWYTNCHYSKCLKGLLLLELSLNLYVLFMNGKTLSKVIFPDDCCVDLRTYEVLDNLGLLITGCKDSSIDIYSTTSERTQRFVNQGQRFIYLDPHQKIKTNFSDPMAKVSNVSYCQQLQLICAISDQNELNYYCWNASDNQFGQIELMSSDSATKARQRNSYASRTVSTNFFKRFDYVAGRKKLWAFVEGKCLYLWHTDFSQTEIYDISNFAERQEIKLLTSVNWGNFMGSTANFGWDSVHLALKEIYETIRSEAKALIMLARLYNSHQTYENILNDCICKDDGDFVLVSLINDPRNSVCQITSAAMV